MVNAFMQSDSIANSLIVGSHGPSPKLVTGSALNSAHAEQVVSRWLAQLLKHFSVQKLDATSDQGLADYLAAFTREDTVNLQCDPQKNELIAELRRRVMRLAGAQLDDAFVSMTPDIIDEADVEFASLLVEGRELQGLRYEGEVYRKMEEFQPCHRLQSYCLAQTLSERQISYVITRSEQRFAVWVNVGTLPRLRH